MELFTEDEYADTLLKRERRDPHPICKMLRALRHASGMSLAAIEATYGIPAVVLGAYERGDREPPLRKLDRVLAVYGHHLAAVPTSDAAVRLPEDAATALRQIAAQLERKPDGLPGMPPEPAHED